MTRHQLIAQAMTDALSAALHDVHDLEAVESVSVTFTADGQLYVTANYPATPVALPPR